jgi:hypothetical protein
MLFPAFTGVRLLKKNSWTWGLVTAEKGRVELLEVTLQKRVTKEGLDGVHLLSTI